ncbi:signal recognition particle-docking protein FtsY [Helicobacter sp. MIT 05-5294]|uniref:signal recognition particle-docking protein FtsY n=1 Tax=Helicobacter sp. MIT 05-5294 TaxID=1548150 RepID=UPI00051FE0F2|nr:signal recognition particle-docking protein FtsY [Helicobacter sp. MIT 05-5294]TLD86791.1 signal recognition particle-docking protein FtsY [Helicobacter sp. MIT 05-5294]
MLEIFKKTLQKTTQNIRDLLPKTQKRISKEELEEILIATDMDYDLLEMILSPLGDEISRGELEVALSRLFRGESYYDKVQTKITNDKPNVHLIIGVNGAGKTTTIAKLANLYKKQGKSVILGAGDTFRAAAIEQLKLWGERLNLPVIASQIGHDPSAVAFDTITSAVAKNLDIAILDTAGRLHNQSNLQQELQKIMRICNKAKAGAPHQKILILDGTQGTSSLDQAKIFSQTLGGIDGVIITKLDGTSKGGAIFSVIHTLRVPILYLGVGENADDLIAFDEKEYITTILDSIFDTTQTS